MSDPVAHLSTPSTAVPPPLIRPFMPELDTVRGLAVLAVMFVHGFFWQYAGFSFGRAARAFLNITAPGGYGVNLFFVLSGLLITGILLDSKNRPNFYRRFYTRRALRILPAYYSLLILLLLLRSSSAAFVGLSFIYLSNLTNFFGVACDYGPLWSLAVEEHFYIVWPMVVRRFAARSLAWVAAAIVVLVPIFRGIFFSLGRRDGLDWYTWFVADSLAAGCLLAIILRTAITRSQIKRLCGTLLGVSLLAALAGQPFGILTRNRLLGAAFQLTLINLFFAGVLLFFLLAGTSSAKRYVNSSILRFFGYISYGLYLDHLLAFRMYDRICRNFRPQLLPTNYHFELVLLRFAVAGGAAVAIAYLSRRFFEEKFLRLKDSLVPQPSAVAAEPVIASTPAADTQVA
jgi:peptidoglycan/LPS O-acetylase OafA/YrhL